METAKDIVELKFEGNGIKPSKVKASEIADLVKHFEAAIMAVVKDQHPELDDDFVLVSFNEIKDESLGLKCLAHMAQQYVMPAYFLITGAVANSSYNSLPNSAIEELRQITRFSKKHNCNGAFIYNGQRYATFNPDTEIAYNENSVVKGETLIYGEVLKAGGVKPRTTLMIDGAYKISFEVSKQIAKKLAANLYSKVSLRGTATWDKKSYRVLEFKASEIFEVSKEDKTLSDTFKELARLLGKHIKDKGDYNQYIN